MVNVVMRLDWRGPESPEAGRYRIEVDGYEIPNVIMADEEGGYVIANVVGEGGSRVVGADPVTYKGTVTITDMGKGRWIHADLERRLLHLQAQKNVETVPVVSSLTLERLEEALRSLMDQGDENHPHLYLTFNEHVYNYVDARKFYDPLEGYVDIEPDWVSPKERERAMELNSVWVVQWYPRTPITSYSVAASSLPALLTHVLSKCVGLR